MDRTRGFLQNIVLSAKNIRSKSFILTALFLLPLCLAYGYLQGKDLDLKAFAQKIETLEQKARSLQRQAARQEKIWEQAKKSKPEYLSQAVEALPLLVPELHRVQALARQYPENRLLQDRLSFLQSEKNRIRFIQYMERTGPFFQEAELKMQNTVQMNENDLKNFLAAVEDANQERPILVIKDFDLKKQKEKADEAVYNIQVELIKRTP
jgi:hypothetical protein